ncbi:MAG: hypothetical protein OM95_00020 [Bdellovibrio sp. ArHS]|uniref:hypothetical protein n=1 Tax=Bdellovibrio sp. ArHS TaxID=1569284 RepID=UPI0005835C64|nr:hypothetical protein [Bdellovibrio sp. ArHS]KHD89962.1 MAG: hypothetical protein OM95_00020 [Bdellovibrio sp. ArHS]
MIKMIKMILPLLVLSLTAQAIEPKKISKTGANSALVRIETEEKDGTQAAAYIDAAEMPDFIQMMLSDSTSEFAKIKHELEMENCQETSTTPDGHIPDCGAVEWTNLVQTSFGRGGWMSAGAAYTLFIGFRFDGTGHFFEASHMVVLSESAEALVDGNMNYTGFINKELRLEKAERLPLIPTR